MKIFLRKKNNFGLIAGIACAALLMIFVLNIFQAPIRSFFYSVSSPIQKTLWQTGSSVANVLGSFINIAGLKRKVNELTHNNQNLTAENARLRYLEGENEVLRKALDIGLRKEYQLIFANIIGKDISQDYLIIDKGSAENISNDMAAITENKVVVGRVSEVYGNFSKIMLISSAKSSFDGRVMGKDTAGLVKGDGRFGAIFDLISRDKDIAVDDTIITNNLGAVFPAGLLVGTVNNVKKDDVEPFLQVEIKPYFDLNSIDFLFLIAERNEIR